MAKEFDDEDFLDYLDSNQLSKVGRKIKKSKRKPEPTQE